MTDTRARAERLADTMFSLFQNKPNRYLVIEKIAAALEEVRPVVPDGWICVREDVIDFISGKSELDMCWFGEGSQPKGANGAFWWRKYLNDRPDNIRTYQEVRNEALDQAIDRIQSRLPKSTKVSENSHIYEAQDWAISICVEILRALKTEEK